MSPRRGLTSDTVMQAAIEMVDTSGIEAVTIASLAAKLNVRSPSLYNHISGLPELKLKLAEYALLHLRDLLQQAMVNSSGESAIYSFCEAYVAFVREHPGLYTATVQAQDPNHASSYRASSEILQLAVHMLEAYSLDETEAIHAVRGLRSILHGFATIEQLGGFGMQINLDDSFHYVIRAYLQGLKSQING